MQTNSIILLVKPSPEKMMLFFLFLSPSHLVPQERLLKLFIYRKEEVEGQDILFFFCQICKDYYHHDPISHKENVTT